MIKFRAIHKNGGNMVDHKEVCRLLYNDACGTMSTIGSYHIMRFIGLTDKNNVEIFEGDKCILHMPNTWGDDDELSKEVPNKEVSIIWKNNGWWLDGFNHLYGTYYWGKIKGDMLEVVGNIYEEQK